MHIIDFLYFTDVPVVKNCQSTNGYFKFDACPSFFLQLLSINITNDVYRNNQSLQRCHDFNTVTIKQKITEFCAASDRWQECAINLKNITKDDKCLQLDKILNIQYICSGNFTLSLYLHDYVSSIIVWSSEHLSHVSYRILFLESKFSDESLRNNCS